MKSYIRPAIIFTLIGVGLGVFTRFYGPNLDYWLVVLIFIFILGFALMACHRDDHGVISSIGRIYLIFALSVLFGMISGSGLLGRAFVSIGKLIS